jgi:hypothetical protein
VLEDRICPKCGGVAPWLKWESVSADGMPSGREYEYKCSRCSSRFFLPGNGQLVLALLTIVGFAAFTWTWWATEWPRMAMVSFAATGALTAQTSMRIRKRMRTRRIGTSPIKSELGK